MTIPESDYQRFAQAFDAVCIELLDDDALARVVHTDGELGDDELSLETAHVLESAGPWGQGFAEPLFEGRFRILDYRILKDRHVKYRIEHPSGALGAIHFDGVERLCGNGWLQVTYRLAINRWRDTENLELYVVDLGG